MQSKKMNCLAHKMVAKVAKELAGAFYDELAKVNDFYAQNPDASAWIALAWPAFLDEARATLAKMLATQIAENLKDDITDALVMDNTLRASRLGIAQITTESHR